MNAILFVDNKMVHASRNAEIIQQEKKWRKNPTYPRLRGIVLR
jgi:hypothetical protein